VIAKDPATGDIPTGTFLLLFPYFFVAIGWWFIRHKLVRRYMMRATSACFISFLFLVLARHGLLGLTCTAGGHVLARMSQILERIEDPYNLVAENIYVGRYPIHFPSQFPVSARVRTGCFFSGSRSCVPQLQQRTAHF